MSEEPQKNPSDSLLLEPEGSSIGDYAIPVGLGLAGIGLIALAMRSSDKKNGKNGKKPKAEDNEVVFGKNYKSFSVGDDWIDLTLDPFLAEQAEENSLITAEYQELMTGMTREQLVPIMKESREENLKVFYSTTKVKTPEGEELISKLPDTKAASDFKKILNDETKDFQEDY